MSILQSSFFREGGAELQRILDEITLTLFSIGTGQGITLKKHLAHLLMNFGGFGVEGRATILACPGFLAAFIPSTSGPAS